MSAGGRVSGTRQPDSTSDEGSTQPRPAAPANKLASALSGSLAGMLVCACVQPFDVLRTRIQADAARGVFVGTAATVRNILATGGIRTLWQGTTPTVVRVGLGAGMQFMIIETLKGAIMQRRTAPGMHGGSAAVRHAASKDTERPHLSATEAMLVGGLSRGLVAVANCPMTVIKTRMEYVPPGSAIVSQGMAGAVRSILRQDGLRGLFRGVVPTVLTNAPFSAFYYTFYTRLKHHLQQTGRPTVVVNLASGTLAGVAAALLTQPTDVVRTHMQLAGAAGGSGSLGTLAALVRQHGARTLLAGAAPRVFKRTVQTALVWALYEELLPRVNALAERNSQRKPGL